jgi:acyl dehydratase
MTPIAIGDRFEDRFVLTDRQVQLFAELSGDTNSIHFDPEAARRSALGTMSVHGMLSALAFSRILGTVFPGDGTVYHSQTLHFAKAMCVNVEYNACITVLELLPEQHAARLETLIQERSSNMTTLHGRALVIHLERL